MPAERGADHRPDWRSGAPYCALEGIDRAGLAWEWLRRDPGYVASWHGFGGTSAPGTQVFPLQADASARPWGLHFRGMSRSSGARRTAALACRF
ncbi:transcriptional regulator domain-containing protein [Sphingobium lignivorans]|uniref:transcriptional regulator domain-containing protein n=1 Tax=Sphingobium TaxID=165695 RepID=UPI001C86BD46